MWVCLQEWLVRDGAVTELRVGQRLHDVGIRANCWSVRDGADEDSIVDLDGSDATTILPSSDVTGTVEWVEPSTVPFEAPVVTTLRVGDVTLLALGPATELAGVDVGARLTVHCSLSVVPDFEWASAMPDVRRTWTVHGIRQAHWKTVTDRQHLDGPAEVLEETEIAAIQPWSDEPGRGPRPAMYQLRLAPA